MRTEGEQIIVARNIAESAAALFSTALFRPLVTKGDSARLDGAVERYRVASRSRARTNAGVIRSAYRFLVHDYPVEYVLRNVAVQQMFLKPWAKDDVCLQELRVSDSIADSVIISGESTVYEIKSRYDSPARLESQLQDYAKAFTRVSVIVDSADTERYLRRLPDHVGLVVYDNQVLHMVRSAKENHSQLDSTAMFDILRVREAEALLEKTHGVAPNVPNTRRYRTWLQLVEQLPLRTLNQEVLDALKARQTSTIRQLRSKSQVRPLHAVLAKLNPKPHGLEQCLVWLGRTPGLTSGIAA